MNNERTAKQTLFDYYEAFNTFDVQTVLPYFHEPCLLLAPQGAFAAPTHSVLAPALTNFIDGLRARGFGRSELRIRRVEPLSTTATLITGVAIRYTVGGAELERVGVTYVLHRHEGSWRIAVLITHEPESLSAK